MFLPVATPRLYFENAAGRLFEHPNGYVLFQYRPGKRQLGDFKALLTHTSLLLRRNRWHRVLSDQRLMSSFPAPESALASTFWLDPSHRLAGVLRAAVVLAEDVFARLATHNLRDKLAAGNINYRTFPDEAAAAAWLAQAP